jgi:Fe-S cluster biogenesis protein NfuA
METIVKSINNTLMGKIENALNSIRPYLNEDGGDVRIVDMTDGVLQIEMLGACGECPMSKMTLKAGIEQAVLKAVPEIRAVRAIN